MNYTELQERCADRNFDQITIVTRDIFKEITNLCSILNVRPDNFQIISNLSHAGLVRNNTELAYEQKQVSFFFENTEICVVEPVFGDTIYQEYLNEYGECICSVRERIDADKFEFMLNSFSRKGIPVIQRIDNADTHAAWLDLRKELGILFEIISDDSPVISDPVINPIRIAQINVTTPDLKQTIETITRLLEIGPWEVGSQNPSTVIDPGFLVDHQLTDPDFEFLVGILVCGNIEWEAIQPVRGPLVYNDFLARRGIGYHHILLEIPDSEWENTLDNYAAKNIELASKGQVGPVRWCYMDTEKELHFYMELRTDAVMDQLPEGYLQYMYPENN